MNPKIINQTEFRVIGISVRTNNAQEMAGTGKIAQLWERFLRDNVMGCIPGKLDHTIFALYTDYASDHNSDYTLVIGARIDGMVQPPSGTVSKAVPGGRYAVFTSEKGPVEKVVPEVWQKIWSLPSSTLGGDRAYLADFEVYDERAANPAHAQVDVYVGIK